MPFEPIVTRLAALITEQGWTGRFETAIAQVVAQCVPAMASIRTIDDYLHAIDAMVRWAPSEAGDSQRVHDKLVEFYFLLDQPALRDLRSPIEPGVRGEPLTPLSAWIADYARAWGAYLDTPASAAHVESFRTNPAFKWDDYMPPPSGYLTFNQFFARHVKPGARPIEALHDARVLVAPADATFIGAWPISADATIRVEPDSIQMKGLTWSIHQLLADSRHADRFAGGTFMHMALRTFDYHRWHAPLAGTVVESRIIQGQESLDVGVEEVSVGGRSQRVLKALEGTGFQFVQTRALVVLETPHGMVACLPVGMAQVSSVVITAEVGVALHKGEEMGYFQFGGSDFVLVVEPSLQATFTCVPDTHYRQGRAIGRCI